MNAPRQSLDSQRPVARRGTLVVCVLVCLLVASSMVVATTQSALRTRRECRTQQQLRQTELLLDAGIRRAIAQLNANEDYEDEEWTPPSISGLTPLVRIQVERESDRPTVQVVASLGIRESSGAFRAATKTQRSLTFQLPTEQPRSPADSSNTTSSAE